VIALVRHGQTAKNRDGLLQGRIDAPLTETGELQAAQLGVAFAEQPVARVVASPLLRAQATAAPIAAAHGLQVESDERLVELDYGEWDERGLGDISPDEWAQWRADSEFAPPGGESLVAVAKRMEQFLAATDDEGLVVAVSHVSPIKAAVCLALGVDQLATWRMHLDLASVTRIGRRGRALYLASFNETA